jgi:hypothetical protein
MKCKKESDNQVVRKFKDKNIVAEIAPEPSDIFWENLGVKFSVRLKKLAMTWLITILALAVSFAISFGINSAQKSIYDDYKDGTQSSQDLWELRIFSIFKGFVIVFINMVLGRLVRIFASYEKH